MTGISRRKDFTSCSSDFRRGRCVALARPFPPSLFPALLVQAIYGIRYKWLRVLATTERTQVNQRIRHQLHPVVSLLNTFKAEQQPLELVLPGKGPLDPQA